jgi:hypothetical protein
MTRTAAEMLDAVLAHVECDTLLMAAAPADFTPAEQFPQKIKKSDSISRQGPTIEDVAAVYPRPADQLRDPSSFAGRIALCGRLCDLLPGGCCVRVSVRFRCATPVLSWRGISAICCIT